MAEAHDAVEVIITKRDGGRLTDSMVDWVVDAYTRGVVSQLHATGGGRLTHFVCVNGAGDVIMPCGRCRQLLFEHGGRDLLLWTVSGIKPMSEVLPDAFGPDDLAQVADSSDPEGRS